jgi:hypothetical protein
MSGSTLSTPKRKAAALEAYRASGVVLLAATAAGVHRATIYNWQRADPAFFEAWQAAAEDAIERLELEARRRALASSDGLLTFLLRSARPDRYVPRVDVRVDVRREAERIAANLGVDAEALISEAERILAASE